MDTTPFRLLPVFVMQGQRDKDICSYKRVSSTRKALV